MRLIVLDAEERQMRRGLRREDRWKALMYDGAYGLILGLSWGAVMLTSRYVAPMAICLLLVAGWFCGCVYLLHLNTYRYSRWLRTTSMSGVQSDRERPTT